MEEPVKKLRLSHTPYIQRRIRDFFEERGKPATLDEVYVAMYKKGIYKHGKKNLSKVMQNMIIKGDIHRIKKGFFQFIPRPIRKPFSMI